MAIRGSYEAALRKDVTTALVPRSLRNSHVGPVIATYRPPPHLNAWGGRMQIHFFSGKGVFLGRSLEKISWENPEGCFFVIAKW